MFDVGEGGELGDIKAKTVFTAVAEAELKVKIAKSGEKLQPSS